MKRIIQPHLIRRALLIFPLILSSLWAQPADSNNNPSQAVNQALIYQDNFEDGDYTSPDGPDGLTWSLIGGGAGVDDVDGSLQLGVDRGYSLIATDQTALCFSSGVAGAKAGFSKPSLAQVA